MAKKYIDADILLKEIERLKRNSESAKREWIKEGYNQNAFAEDCRISSFDKLLSFIVSLQQEQPEVYLEKEIETSIRLLNGLHTLEDNKSWYKGRYEELKELARHFYELGKNSKQ